MRTAALVAIPGLGSPGSTKTLMSEALGGNIWDRSRSTGSDTHPSAQQKEEEEESSTLEESLLLPDSGRGSKRHGH